MNTTGLYENRIKVMHLKDNHAAAQDNHSSKHYKECHIHINDTNDSDDKSRDESDSPTQLNSTDSNKIVNQGYKILLLMGPGKFTSISMKYTETTNTSTFTQDIPCHLYEGIFTIVHLLLSLLVSVRNRVLPSSLLVSLQSTPLLYTHLHCQLYGKYSYDISTKISLLSYAHK